MQYSHAHKYVNWCSIIVPCSWVHYGWVPIIFRTTICAFLCREINQFTVMFLSSEVQPLQQLTVTLVLNQVHILVLSGLFLSGWWVKATFLGRPDPHEGIRIEWKPPKNVLKFNFYMYLHWDGSNTLEPFCDSFGAFWHAMLHDTWNTTTLYLYIETGRVKTLIMGLTSTITLWQIRAMHRLYGLPSTIASNLPWAWSVFFDGGSVYKKTTTTTRVGHVHANKTIISKGPWWGSIFCFSGEKCNIFYLANRMNY